MSAARLRARIQARRVRRALLLAVVIALVAIAGSSLGTVSATTLPTVTDAWSSKVTLTTTDGWYASPIHATLMPDGRVLFVGTERPHDPGLTSDSTRRSAWVMTPSAVGATLPPTMNVTHLTEPVEYNFVGNGTPLTTVTNDDLFCMGNVHLADGRLLTTGGTRAIVTLATGATNVNGLDYATLTDGTTWSRVAARMQGVSLAGGTARWYPTNTRLPDGRILVTGGFDLVQPSPAPNLTTEVFDPATQSLTVTSDKNSTPLEIFNSDYPHAFALPSKVSGADVVMIGEPGTPVLYQDGTPAHWAVIVTKPRPGTDAFQQYRSTHQGAWISDQAPLRGASSAMLPIRINDGEWGYRNGAISVAGGALGLYDSNLDVYDTAANAWQPMRQMSSPRQYAIQTLLPDGKVLVVNGATPDANALHAEYLDPAHGMAQSVGSSATAEVRGYHGVSLLLPDGRVLVGGGRDVTIATSVEKPNFRYYSPPYMSQPRPQIVTAPSTIRLGQPFAVRSTGAAPSEMVLMSLGSMTHAIDMDQRSVQVLVAGTHQTASGDWQALAYGPASATVAPPGYYMLFVLDANRVPSVAKIVKVVG